MKNFTICFVALPVILCASDLCGQSGSLILQWDGSAAYDYFGKSVAGGGPINTPYGRGFVSAPDTLIRLTADAGGSAGMPQTVPGSASGLSVWFHGLDLASATLLIPLALSNSVSSKLTK